MTLISVAKYPDILQATVNKELTDKAKWLKVNKLSLNIKRTQFMALTRRKGTPTKIDIKIDNRCINKTKVSEFLGTNIDNNLNWKSHISYIAGKIARRIGIITKARKYFICECMINFHSFILILFIIIVFGESSLKQGFVDYNWS